MDVVTYAAGKNYTDKEVKRISELSGAVLSVNGKSGEVEGLAEQKSVDELTTQLADTAINVKRQYGAGSGNEDDKNKIEKALLDVPNNGTLYFPEGTYNISTFVEINKSVKITMSENAKVVSTNTSAVKSTHGVFFITSDNVTLENVVIDVNGNQIRGIRSLSPVENLVIKNLKVENSKMTGVWIDGVTNLRVDGIITNNCDSGLDGEQGSVRVENCQMFNMENISISESRGKGLAFKNSRSGNLRGVIVDTTYNLQPGLYLNACEKVFCSNIHVIDGDNSALKFSRNTFDCHVRDSVFQTKEKGGVYGGYAVIFQGVVDCSMSTSTIIDKGSTAAVRIEDHPEPEGGDCLDNKIYNNKIVVFDSAKQYSVYLNKRTDANFLSSGHEIDGNQIIGGIKGVYIINVNDVKVINNTFKDQAGIVIHQTGTNLRGLSILDNIIKNASDYILQTNAVNNVKVKGNTFVASDSIPSLKDGIRIGTNTKNIDISNNTFVGFTGNAVNGTASGIEQLNISFNVVDGKTKTLYGVYLSSNVASARVVANDVVDIVTNKFFVSPSIEAQYVAGNI